MKYRAALPWLGLAAILLGYVAFIVRLHPINLFGNSQDDPIYFSSAKAIAQDHRYVLPSFPGAPPAANKFPVLYPWMLSWIWRWNPAFPANVNDAVALTVGFGIVYLAFAFIFFRRSIEMGDAGALILTAFCAFHPAFLSLSAQILSDVPFAALCLGSLVLADKAMQREGFLTRAIFCGILAGLSILIRATGFPIVLGILAVAVLRKAWRQAATFASTVAVFFSFLVWEKLSAAKASLPAGWNTSGPGFRQTWLFYTDYVGFRALSAPSIGIATRVFVTQFLYLCRQLPVYFLSPSFDRFVALLLVLFTLIVASLVRTIRLEGWKPIHASFVLYLALVLAWNYPDWDRFLIPFLPLLAASLWMEGRWLAGEIVRQLRSARSRTDRVAAALFGFGLAALALAMTYGFITNSERRDLLTMSRGRGALLIEKREAYDWLQRNSPEDSRVIAGENAPLYLYTGRQSMMPVVMLPIGIYEPKQMHSDTDHIMDVASQIKATYWLASVDDRSKQLVGDQAPLAARLGEIERVLPELYRSSSGNVRIYGLGCVQNPGEASCQLADRVLFPEGEEHVTKAY